MIEILRLTKHFGPVEAVSGRGPGPLGMTTP